MFTGRLGWDCGSGRDLGMGSRGGDFSSFVAPAFGSESCALLGQLCMFGSGGRFRGDSPLDVVQVGSLGWKEDSGFDLLVTLAG